MEKVILRKRSDVSVLSEMQKGSRIRGNRENQIKKRYNIKCVDDISVVREKLKQQIQAKAQRIRRFEKRNNFSRQNKVFKKDAKKFYRELGKKTITLNKTPSVQGVEAFWSNI